VGWLLVGGLVGGLVEPGACRAKLDEIRSAVVVAIWAAQTNYMKYHIFHRSEGAVATLPMPTPWCEHSHIDDGAQEGRVEARLDAHPHRADLNEKRRPRRGLETDEGEGSRCGSWRGVEASGPAREVLGSEAVEVGEESPEARHWWTRAAR